MAPVDALRERAYDLYARARKSVDLLAKQALTREADDFLKEAEILRSSSVIQAAFPKSDKTLRREAVRGLI